MKELSNPVILYALLYLWLILWTGITVVIAKDFRGRGIRAGQVHGWKQAIKAVNRLTVEYTNTICIRPGVRKIPLRTGETEEERELEDATNAFITQARLDLPKYMEIGREKGVLLNAMLVDRYTIHLGFIRKGSDLNKILDGNHWTIGDQFGRLPKKTT